MYNFLKLKVSDFKKGVFAIFIIAGLGISGCDILEVENPNSLKEEDLDNPVAAPSIANGAEANLTNALGDLLAPYSTITDELTWIGTRDAWEQLNQGEVEDETNEFADAAFMSISEARWSADNAINRLENFKEEGDLRSNLPLIRSYFYGAVAYITISNAFDNFVISDRREASPPIGESNMDQLYDTAIGYLTKGLNLTENDSEWEARLLALRARAYYSKALWAKLNPDLVTSDPLVQSENAVQDAEAALTIIGPGNDWNYQVVVTPDTPDNYLAFQINERLELRFSDSYIETGDEDSEVASVTLEDPIDNIPAPYLADTIFEFVEQNEYANITVVSERELHLIIAEDALARNEDQDFEGAINALRDLDDLSDYTGQIPAQELLEHSRRVNLFIQGQRLADQYRFEDSSPEWTSNRLNAGSFLPITITEIRSNPNVDF
jgi:hypothetical protein